MPTLKNVRHEVLPGCCEWPESLGVLPTNLWQQKERRCAWGRVDETTRRAREGCRASKGARLESKLSREEALEWLSNLIRTPIGSVGKDSPLVQAYEEDSEGKVKVRLADKIAGMQTLSKMTGWFEPEKTQVSGDTLSAYVVALRARPIFELERPALSLENGGNGNQ